MDLLLVAGDPTSDITATRAITGIWRGGTPFDRETYRASLQHNESEPPGR